MKPYLSDIKKIVSELKYLGMDRRAIERELDYHEFYIDQAISKGGNKILLESLSRLLLAKKLEEESVSKSYLEEFLLNLRADVNALKEEVAELKRMVKPV